MFARKGTKAEMTKGKVCVFAGKTGNKELAFLEKYARGGCRIAFMNENKELGRRLKRELENNYHVEVFFFHGDIGSEEDCDIFFTAVQEMYGNVDYVICRNNE